MSPSEIDFTSISHLIHFSVFPMSTGVLSLSDNGLTPASMAAAVAQAHSANRKILICVGGAGSNFEPPASNHLSAFVLNLTNLMATNGYDGIDVDWEPLPDSDEKIFTNFVTQLRSALNHFPSHKILTVAVPTDTTPTLIASVQSAFDQINLMTYDMSGPYPGWITWFNAPIYNEGITFPSVPGEYVPSIDDTVNTFVSGGIPTNKLGIGIPFYGYDWEGGTGTSTGGVTQPAQSWSKAPSMNAWTYTQIMTAGFSASQFHYDSGAQSPYVSVTNSNSSLDQFIPFDDARSCEAKVSYARNRGLGGVIIFELSEDHQSGQTDPLLNAINQVFATPGALAIQPSGQNVDLSFSSAPLGSYAIQWSTNLTGTVWNSLLMTNLPLTFTGGVIQATDSASSTQMKFYRVKTPP